MTCLAAICLAAGSFYVVDADTIGRPGAPNLRLWGIDAEERGHREWSAAKAAMQRLTGGQGLACTDRGKDATGRRIETQCTLTTGPHAGADIACAMVAAGYAEDWPRYSGGYYARCEAD